MNSATPAWCASWKKNSRIAARDGSGESSADRIGQPYTRRKGGAKMSERNYIHRDAVQALGGGRIARRTCPA